MQTQEDRTVISSTKRARDRLAKLLSDVERVPTAAPTAPRIVPDEERSEPKGMLREMAAVSTLLRSHQLVTLVGDAGAGKSVLARSLGRSQRDTFPGGVFHCDVSSVATLRELLETVAVAVGMGPVPEGTADAIGAVETALACRQRTLLVVDGFDDLSLLAGDTLARWIFGSSHLSVLVTAREPLFVQGEEVFLVERTRAAPPAALRGAA